MRCRASVLDTSLSFDLRSLDWGSLYVASEWVIRVAALIVRAAAPPAERRARVAAVHLLPALAGRAVLLADRPRVPAAPAVPRAEADLRDDPAHRAARVVGRGRRARRRCRRNCCRRCAWPSSCPSSPSSAATASSCCRSTTPPSTASSPTSMRAQRYVHMLFYIFENDDVGRRVADALERARAARRRRARADGRDRLARRAEGPGARACAPPAPR